MNQVEIMEFVNKNPAFSLATCADNVPHVRMMAVAFADSRGIIFSTGRDKDVCKQIRANPRIEMCFYCVKDEIQLRIAATAVETDDVQLKKDIVEKFDFLKPWIDAEGYDILATFRIKDAAVTTWTMAEGDKPKEYVSLTNL
ncbi:MAG: pyridoxamine 5'-phosphate oxidase family protein [Phycisphaerae bacterium]|nr:pyridoxamine 5'-phosphate oxidase family protein [Phycisphaerae bacterium]